MVKNMLKYGKRILTVLNKVKFFYKKTNFDDFENIINSVFTIESDISARFLQRILISTITKRSRINIFDIKISILSFSLFIPIIFYLLLSLLLGNFSKNKKHQADIILELWNKSEKDNENALNRFYSNMIPYFKNYNLYLFQTRNTNTKLSKKYSLDVIVSNDIFLNKNDSIKLLVKTLLNLKKIFTLTYRKKINFIYLYAKFFYHFILYTLKAQQISNIKYLISAGDNYYDALMYKIYQNNNIHNICLLQTSMRGEDYLSSFFITCDHYFKLDQQLPDNFLGLKAYQSVTYTGSVRLYNTISSINIQQPKFDIVFLETPFYKENILDPNNSLYLHSKAYFETLQLLSEFSKQFPKLKILYRVKRLMYDRGHTFFLEKRDEILSSSNIIFDSNLHANSYEAILNSQLIIYVVTTMGVEAITMGKKVLCCNLEKFPFLLSDKDEIGVLTKNDYFKFEKKILYLLSDHDIHINTYFEEKRKKYGNIMDNPNLIILQTLNLGN